MKKRFAAIFTATVAAVLISSIAYAAKKKLQTKSKPKYPDVSEVDLAADLLDAKGYYKQKTPTASNSNKHIDEELKDLAIAKKPDK